MKSLIWRDSDLTNQDWQSTIIEDLELKRKYLLYRRILVDSYFCILYNLFMCINSQLAE